MAAPEVVAMDVRAGNSRHSGKGDENQVPPGTSDVSKNTFLYGRLLSKVPTVYAVFAVTFLLHCSMIAVSGILYATDYPILKFEFFGVPLELRNSEIRNKHKSWTASSGANGNIHSFYPSNNYVTMSYEERFLLKYDGNSKDYFAEFVVEKEGENLLTKENLQKLQKLENQIIKDKYYVCNENQCKPYSILRIFDGSFVSTNAAFNDTEFDDIPNVLTHALNHTSTKYLLEPLLSKSAEINSRVAKSTVTFISFYTATSPTNSTILAYWTDKFDNWHKDGFEGLDLYIMSNDYYIEKAIEMVYVDMYLIIGSCVFIFLFMWFQTNSLWLSGWGIFSTLVSFVTANLLYTTVFGYRYFGIFHVLSVFIILGIGADDVFIFCDTWKSTGYEKYPTLAHRVSDCYKRAAKPMFVTSVTTAAAFLIGAISPILAISSFGLFSGLVIIINYLSIVIFYPSIVVIYHLHFENLCCAYCRPEVPSSQTNDSKNTRFIVRFLTFYYLKVIKNRVFQVLSLIAFAAFMATCIYFTAILGVDAQEPRYLRANHNTELSVVKRLNDFKAQKPNSNANMYVVWGLADHAQEECHSKEFKEECMREWLYILNRKFDLNPTDAQKDLTNFCDYLNGMSNGTKDELKIRKHPVTGQREIYCFLLNMKEAVESSTTVTFPMNKAKVMEVYNIWKPVMSHYYQLNANFTKTRFMEELYGMWSNNDYVDKRYYGAQIGLEQKFNYNANQNVIQNANASGSTTSISQKRLAFVAVKVPLNIFRLTDSYIDGMNLYDKWEKIVKTKISDMSSTMNEGFQTTDSAWAWFEQMQAFTRQGIVTICVGISIAWVILILFCQNWIIGTIATGCIICVSVSVLGMTSMLGWKYGIIESLNTILVVGLSIDYVVHFGVAYTSSKQTDRAGRVEDALSEIGLPVLSGAATTLGSSFFMLFTNIQFFFQFGIFMFCTIGFSILYTMVVFLIVLLLIGPQGTTGSNWVIWRAIKRNCFKCKTGTHAVTASNGNNVTQ